MAWGNASNVSTTNLDSGTDSPALARVDLKAALDELTAVINGRAQANGVAPLGADAKVPATNLPNELNTSTNIPLTLDPSTGKVNIEEVLNLDPQTVAQLESRTDVELGDIAFCSNGDSGNPCLAVANEIDSLGNLGWYRIALGTNISAS